jgi:chaperonin GroES
MELRKKIKLDKVLGAANVAEYMHDDDLCEIASECHAGYELDKKSREGWEDSLDTWMELALQAQEHKTYPWPGAANIKYPLISTAALQFSARAYASLLPGTNLVKGRVIGKDDTGEKHESAIRVSKHMSYQLLEEMPDWEEQMDRLLFSLPIVGCMFKKTYFDSVRGHNVSEIVYPKELVVNYFAKNLEEAPRVSHCLYMSENELFERKATGLYLDEELEKNLDEVQEKVSEDITGVEKPKQVDSSLPYMLIEQHTWLDLDCDGYAEPYIVTFDYNSKRILRIVARFGEEDIKYNAEGSMMSIKPRQYFTKFSFIPSPDGSFYDIGFGVLLGPINETINTLINQLVDSGSLANLQAGFISNGIRIKGGDRNMRPGEWKTVNSTGDDLRKGLVPLPTKDPSSVLFQLLGMMISSGERLSSVTEVMTGDIPGQNTKATVAMAAIEQGMKVFSSIYKRVHRSLTKEYRKLFKLNSMFLEEEVYFTVLDVGQEVATQVGLKDYDPSGLDIVPASDPSLATEEQKLMKVQALGELAAGGLVNAQEYAKRYLEATEQPNIGPLMDVPQKGPSIEEQKLAWEKEKFHLELQERAEERELEMMKMRAETLKLIAEAEAAEEGQQLDLYKKEMEMLEQGEGYARNEEMHQQKMGQNDMAFAQKQRQQEEMAQQRLQQQAAKGAINGGNSDPTGGQSGA